MSKNSVARAKAPSNEAKRSRRRFVTNGEPQKAKVSIAVEPSDLAWAEAQAKANNTSLSAVFGDALGRARRSHAWNEYLEEALEGKPFTEAELAKSALALQYLDEGRDVRVDREGNILWVSESSKPKRGERAATG
jgi:hypothetical protein